MSGLDPSRYDAPYISEILRESDGDLNDCTVCSVLMLGADWTLGELLLRPSDWKPRDVIRLREASRTALGPEKQDGGLTLADGDAILQHLDPELPPLPRYPGAGGSLRLSFGEFWALISNGHVGVLIGIPARVADEASPLRTKQAFDGYAHAIHVSRGQQARARVKDPLTRHGEGWDGEWVPREDLRQFASAFGTESAIGCAVVGRGEQSREARTHRTLHKTIVRKELALDKANADLAAARRRIAELEAAQDCDAVVAAARAQALADAVAAVEGLS